MKRYAIAIEKPDLPGCIAAGDTLEETELLMREAIEFHLEGMRAHSDRVPEPTAVAAVSSRYN